jgi:hypothetical protein
VITVLPALPQEFGPIIPVDVQPQQHCGMEINAFAQLANTDLTALNVQPQDIGTQPPINVYVIHLSFGTIKIVSVLLLISSIKEDVLNALMDLNGQTINVKNVIVHSKICKF